MKKNIKAFTLVEIIIVISILAIINSFSLDIFQNMNRRIKYERFIYRIQQQIKQARNKTYVIEGEYKGGSFSWPQAYGVILEKISKDEFTTSLVQYTKELTLPITETSTENLFDDDNYQVLDSLKEERLLGNQGGFKAIIKEGTIEKTGINKILFLFTPEPNLKAYIISQKSHKIDNYYLYSEVDLRFFHWHRETKTLRKKISYDIISQVAEVNDYPKFVRLYAKNNNTLQVITNDKIKEDKLEISHLILKKINGDTVSLNNLNKFDYFYEINLNENLTKGEEYVLTINAPLDLVNEYDESPFKTTQLSFIY
jgi:prepilin-type N-terminal cleavage/methylation domain-containing protein